MATDTFQVDTYTYYHWSSRLHDKSNLLLRGEGKTCSVWFVEDPAAPLPHAAAHGAGHYLFYYHHHQMTALIDMLRHENPVFVHFDDTNGWANSRISTSAEPVGDGELP